MDHFKLWLKNQTHFNTLSDDAFKNIEHDVVNYFGGVRHLIALLLKKPNHLTYHQHIDLSSILNPESPAFIESNDSFHLSLISTNSLSRICEFLTEKDEFNLKCTNTMIFYSEFGKTDFFANKIDYLHYLNRWNSRNTASSRKYIENELVSKWIQNVLTLNEETTQSLTNLTDNFFSIDSRAITNTGLLQHLKKIMIHKSDYNHEMQLIFKLFLFLYIKESKRFCNILNDELLLWFNKVLANCGDDIIITFVLQCIMHTLQCSPQFVCHVIRHNLDGIILQNVLKWIQMKELVNATLYNLSLRLIVLCDKRRSKTLINDNILQLISVGLRSINNYINKGWKNDIYKGMKVGVKGDDEHEILRIFADEKYMDKKSKKIINSNNEEKDPNPLWAETKTKYRKNSIYTINLNHRSVFYPLDQDTKSCFVSLIDLLCIYRKDCDLDLKKMGLFEDIKCLADALIPTNHKFNNYKKDEFNRNERIFDKILNIDFVNGFELALFNTKKEMTSINWEYILLHLMNKQCFDYLFKYKCFHYQSFASLSSIRLKCRMLLFLYDKLKEENERWDSDRCCIVLQSLINTKISDYKMKIFLKEIDEILINLTKLLIKMDVANDPIYGMISFCIEQIIKIITFCENEKDIQYDLTKHKYYRLISDVLQQKNIMDRMKCDQNGRRYRGIEYKKSFLSILSLPNTIIIDDVIMYLNVKNGDVQDWYHNRSLRWIIRFVTENNKHNLTQNINALMNVIQYASDHIRYKTNFDDCKMIVELIVKELPIYKYNKDAVDDIDNQVLYQRLTFLNCFAQPYGVADHYFKVQLLRIYEYESQYNADVIDLVRKSLKRLYKIDVDDIDNKKYNQSPPFLIPEPTNRSGYY